MRPLLILLAGAGIAAVVYVATSGRVVFLPLILLLPLGLVAGRRRR